MSLVNRIKKKVKVGSIDKQKESFVKLTQLANKRQAGMMLQNIPSTSNPYIGNNSLSGYFNSSNTGTYSRGYDGTRDVPAYFAGMNMQNGGILYYPVNPLEKMEWMRYFARTDSYVSRSLSLHCDLPLSKIMINPPKIKIRKGKYKSKLNSEIAEEISMFFTYMCDELDLYDKLKEILWEMNVIGAAYPFIEYDEKKQMWGKITLLPPEEIDVFGIPFGKNTYEEKNNESRIEYRPRVLLDLIKEGSTFEQSTSTWTEEELTTYENIPKDMITSWEENGYLKLNDNPFYKNNRSFCWPIFYNKFSYHDKGYSPLESIIIPLLLREHYKHTQLNLASRNMTPKNVIYGEGVSQPQLDDLRYQVDMSYMNPDASIVTNYPVTWEQIGSENRLLDLTSEYEQIENQIFAGLGVTRELLTGEGSYSGTRITIEIMNTMFMNVRQRLEKFVNDMLFKPICEQHKWYDEIKLSNGITIKEYWTPRLGFNRITIRDNAEVFDQVFQLYQKGSIPIDVIYELLNLDSDSMQEKIKQDLYTVKDPMFNNILDQINGQAFSEFGNNTNLPEKVAKYLGLKYKKPEPEDGSGEPSDQWGNDEDSSWGADKEESSNEDVEADSIADSIVDKLPANPTEEEINKLVDKQLGDK